LQLPQGSAEAPAVGRGGAAGRGRRRLLHPAQPAAEGVVPAQRPRRRPAGAARAPGCGTMGVLVLMETLRTQRSQRTRRAGPARGRRTLMVWCVSLVSLVSLVLMQ